MLFPDQVPVSGVATDSYCAGTRPGPTGRGYPEQAPRVLAAARDGGVFHRPPKQDASEPISATSCEEDRRAGRPQATEPGSDRLLLAEDAPLFRAFAPPPEPQSALVGSLDAISDKRRDVRTLLSPEDYTLRIPGPSSLAKMPDIRWGPVSAHVEQPPPLDNIDKTRRGGSLLSPATEATDPTLVGVRQVRMFLPATDSRVLCSRAEFVFLSGAGASCRSLTRYSPQEATP